MSDSKRRFLVHCEYDTSCWIYDDLHGAQKRLSSGLKAPPNAQDFTIKQVQFIAPNERVFSREMIIQSARKVEKELGYEPTVHDLLNELFPTDSEAGE